MRAAVAHAAVPAPDSAAPARSRRRARARAGRGRARRRAPPRAARATAGRRRTRGLGRAAATGKATTPPRWTGSARRVATGSTRASAPTPRTPRRCSSSMPADRWASATGRASRRSSRSPGSIAAALGTLLVEQGDTVGLYAATAPETWLAPGGGAHHGHVLVEALAQLGPVRRRCGRRAPSRRWSRGCAGPRCWSSSRTAGMVPTTLEALRHAAAVGHDVAVLTTTAPGDRQIAAAGRRRARGRRDRRGAQRRGCRAQRRRMPRRRPGTTGRSTCALRGPRLTGARDRRRRAAGAAAAPVPHRPGESRLIVGIEWLSPAVLGGLVLVAVPIAIHLFARTPVTPRRRAERAASSRRRRRGCAAGAVCATPGCWRCGSSPSSRRCWPRPARCW